MQRFTETTHWTYKLPIFPFLLSYQRTWCIFSGANLGNFCRLTKKVKFSLHQDVSQIKAPNTNTMEVCVFMCVHIQNWNFVFALDEEERLKLSVNSILWILILKAEYCDWSFHNFKVISWFHLRLRIHAYLKFINTRIIVTIEYSAALCFHVFSSCCCLGVV